MDTMMEGTDGVEIIDRIIGILMQSDVVMADRSESSGSMQLVSVCLDQFVPESAEVMLWPRKSMVYVTARLKAVPASAVVTQIRSPSESLVL
jgi:hypothetical protein